MDDSSIQEKRKYQKIWNHKNYGIVSPGMFFFSLFEKFFEKKIKANDLLTDFGCGSAQLLRKYLSYNLQVQLIDITKNCLGEDAKLLLHLFKESTRFFEASLWNLPKEVKKSQWMICADVLEHIPTEKLEETLAGIAKCHYGGGLFCIAMYEDTYGKAIGQPLHLSIFDEKKWKELLSKHWDILFDSVIEGPNYVAMVKRRTIR